MILDSTKVVEGLEMFLVMKVHDFSLGELGVMNFRCSLSGFDLCSAHHWAFVILDIDNCRI